MTNYTITLYSKDRPDTELDSVHVRSATFATCVEKARALRQAFSGDCYVDLLYFGYAGGEYRLLRSFGDFNLYKEY